MQKRLTYVARGCDTIAVRVVPRRSSTENPVMPRISDDEPEWYTTRIQIYTHYVGANKGRY
jgi:hypothetical protein